MLRPSEPKYLTNINIDVCSLLLKLFLQIRRVLLLLFWEFQCSVTICLNCVIFFEHEYFMISRNLKTL